MRPAPDDAAPEGRGAITPGADVAKGEAAPADEVREAGSAAGAAPADEVREAASAAGSDR